MYGQLVNGNIAKSIFLAKGTNKWILFTSQPVFYIPKNWFISIACFHRRSQNKTHTSGRYGN